MAFVLHTADTHLGYKQYQKSERREDFMDAFHQVIDDAIDHDVDAVIHAGDLLERPNVWPEINTTIVHDLNRLDDHDIQFLSVLGNHDRANRGEWLDLFAASTNSATRLGTDPVIIGDTAFYGLDYVGTTKRESLDYQFTPCDDDDVTHHVLVAHGLFNPPNPYGDWDLHEILFRTNIPFDAILLGDDHTHRIEELDPNGPGAESTVVTYSGSTERTAADQRAARRYNLVELGTPSRLADAESSYEGKTVTITEQSLDTRPFEYFDINLEADSDITDIKDQIRSREVTDSVVIVKMDGDPEAPRMSTSAIEEFAEEAAGAFYASAQDDRELETEQPTTDVSFANPDEAVRERVKGMEVSPIVRELETEIRSDTIKKSNLQNETKERLRNALEENPDALRSPEEMVEDPEDPARGESEKTESGLPASEHDTESSPSSDTSSERDPDQNDDTDSTESRQSSEYPSSSDETETRTLGDY